MAAEEEQRSTGDAGRRILWLCAGVVLWAAVAVAVASVMVAERRSGRGTPERAGEAEPLVRGVEHQVEVVKDGAGERKRITLKLPEPLWDPTGVADFELVDHRGRTVTKATLLGRPWVVGFIFTRCAGPCPRLTKAMHQLLPYAKRAGARLVTITVDPDHDTPEVLARYAEVYGAHDDDWLFLSGPKDEVYSLIRGSFLMPVQEVTGPQRKPGFEVVHSTNFLLVDATGRVVEKFNGQLDEDLIRLTERLREMARRGGGGGDASSGGDGADTKTPDVSR